MQKLESMTVKTFKTGITLQEINKTNAFTLDTLGTLVPKCPLVINDSDLLSNLAI